MDGTQVCEYKASTATLALQRESRQSKSDWLTVKLFTNQLLTFKRLRKGFTDHRRKCQTPFWGRKWWLSFQSFTYSQWKWKSTFLSKRRRRKSRPGRSEPCREPMTLWAPPGLNATAPAAGQSNYCCNRCLICVCSSFTGRLALFTQPDRFKDL